MSINRDVRAIGVGPTHGVALPAADGVGDHDLPLLDRVGELVRDRSWLPAGGLLLGGALGGFLAGRAGAGFLGRAGSVVAGMLVGTTTALGAGIAVGALRDTSIPAPDAPEADPDVRADEHLRVMTYNVHGSQGPGGEHFTSDEELDRLAESIRRERPDVVLLQELDRFATRSSHRETLAELAERLDATSAVFTPRGTMVTGRQEGTGVLTFNGIEVADARGIITADPYGADVLRRGGAAIASGVRGFRNEVLGHQVQDKGQPDYFPRVTTDAMLVTPAGNHVRVMSGHYNGPRTDTDYQQIQVEPVAELVDDWDGPTIWGADFNVRSGGPNGTHERELLAAQGLTDTFVEAGVKPGNAARAGDIDRIYGSDHFEVDAVRVPTFPDGEPDPSDHRPVVADLHLRAGGGGGG